MLTITQQRENPTREERRILTSLAGGSTRAEAALAAGISRRSVDRALESMRDRFAPTTCSLIAIAVQLHWIAVPIWIPRH